MSDETNDPPLGDEDGEVLPQDVVTSEDFKRNSVFRFPKKRRSRQVQSRVTKKTQTKRRTPLQANPNNKKRSSPSTTQTPRETSQETPKSQPSPNVSVPKTEGGDDCKPVTVTTTSTQPRVEYPGCENTPIKIVIVRPQ